MSGSVQRTPAQAFRSREDHGRDALRETCFRTPYELAESRLYVGRACVHTGRSRRREAAPRRPRSRFTRGVTPSFARGSVLERVGTVDVTLARAVASAAAVALRWWMIDRRVSREGRKQPHVRWHERGAPTRPESPAPGLTCERPACGHASGARHRTNAHCHSLEHESRVIGLISGVRGRDRRSTR